MKRDVGVNLKILLFTSYMSFLIVLNPFSIYSQDKFLLTSEEMVGFELKEQYHNGWNIGINFKNRDAIEQKWHVNAGDQNQNIYISYCEFNNEMNAIMGTAYAATKSNAVYSTWGSLSGASKGDGSWLSLNDGGAYYVRGNIGVKIFKPNFTEVDRIILISILEKIRTKIELNLSLEILEFEETKKEKQIPNTEYRLITDPVAASPKMINFSLSNNYDSKWLTDSTNLVMGIRNEWDDPSGKVISVDICKFDSKEDAEKAVEIRARMIPTTRIFPLDNLDSLKSIVSQHKFYDSKKTSFFMLGIMDNFVIHYYYFDPDSIDWDFFYSIAEDISAQIVKFLITSIASAEGHAAAVNFKTFVLKQNYPNPFNASTIIGYVLQKPTNISLKVFDINGREVNTLVNDFHSAGNYQIQWNGNDSNGKSVSSGTYIYTLKTETLLISKTMTLLK